MDQSWDFSPLIVLIQATVHNHLMEPQSRLEKGLESTVNKNYAGVFSDEVREPLGLHYMEDDWAPPKSGDGQASCPAREESGELNQAWTSQCTLLDRIHARFHTSMARLWKDQRLNMATEASEKGRERKEIERERR